MTLYHSLVKEYTSLGIRKHGIVTSQNSMDTLLSPWIGKAEETANSSVLGSVYDTNSPKSLCSGEHGLQQGGVRGRHSKFMILPSVVVCGFTRAPGCKASGLRLAITWSLHLPSNTELSSSIVSLNRGGFSRIHHVFTFARPLGIQTTNLLRACSPDSVNILPSSI